MRGSKVHSVEPLHAFTMPPVDTIRVTELVGDCGGVELVSKRFSITVELLSLWMSGEVEPPKYFLIALWWQSWRGYDQGFSETHYANMVNYRRLCEAQKRVALLEEVVLRSVERLGHDGAHLKRIAFPS